MGELAGPPAHPLSAIQANLEREIPQLYRELALYLQVLREVLPASLDQACAHLVTQVHPRRYNRLPQRVRDHLHARLRTQLTQCCALLTVEQLQSLASQMAQERQRAQPRREGQEEGLEPSPSHDQPLPSGSIQLSLTPPLTGDPFGWSPGWLDLPSDPDSGESRFGSSDGEAEAEGSPLSTALAEGLLALAHSSSAGDSLWSDGQLPRDPVLLVHWLEGVEVALGRRLRNLSHGVNKEFMRAGLLPAVVPVRLLDSILSGQIEAQGAPANLLRLPLPPSEAGRVLQAPLGVLLRTVDLEMEQPRLRTCRRRLLHQRQEILKMAETFHRLQRRLQAQQAERLWRHDSQLNRPETT